MSHRLTVDPLNQNIAIWDTVSLRSYEFLKITI